MRIAFVTPGYDPQDIRRGSGTFYYLSHEIERQGWRVHYIGPLNMYDPAPTRVLRMLSHRLFKNRYLTYMDPWVAQARGRALANRLQGISYDLILTNDHGVVASTQTDKPIILYTDVLLPIKYAGTRSGAYNPYSRVSRLMYGLYQSTIKRSLQKATHCIFPAEWQVREAQKYGIPASKISLIPFGANIPDPGRIIAENRDFHHNVSTHQLNLLFVGKDWQRKGGDIAIKITDRLQESGIDAQLHIVGNKLDKLESYVHSYGLLDKNVVDDWEMLDKLYRQSDIFLFPSRSEGSAIVPREAAAYGLPTLGYKIDGLVGAVADSQSGILFDLSAGIDSYVGSILHWFQYPDDYNYLAVSSRNFYDENANWPASVRKLMEEIEASIK